MKEKIYTIPLSDSFDNTEMCPFCFLEDKLERESVEYALGPSMMEPDSRQESNEKGFCRKHLNMMLKKNEKLSLALMLTTHLEHIREQLGKMKFPENGGFMKKGKAGDISGIEKCTDGCVICEKMEYNTKRYAEVFHYLCRKEPEFREKVKRCENLCLPHGVMLLKDAKREEAELVAELLKKSLDVNIAELKAFVDLFDYRAKKDNMDMHREAVKNAVVAARGSLENIKEG